MTSYSRRTMVLACAALAAAAALASGAVASTPPDLTGRQGDHLQLNVNPDAGGPVLNWSWDFEGDGTFDWNSSAGPNTTHVYASSGTFNAVLEAHLANGTLRSWTYQVLVRPRDLPPAVTIAKGPDGYIRTDRLTPVALDGVAVDADGTVVLYEWDFDGDGTFDWSSTASPATTHTYGGLGDLDAVLRATDDGGQRGEDRVRVEVRNLPPALEAAPNVTTDVPLVELAVSASDRDGRVVSFTWSFGDGTGSLTTATPSASHDFGGTGRWMARVVATDDDGGNSSIVLWVEVTQPAGRVPPTVSAGGDVTAKVGETVNFEATATNGSGAIVSYAWDLDGDGKVDAMGPVQTWTYSRPGTYLATVTVSDTNGLNASAARRVVVAPVKDLPPVAVPSVEQWVAPGKTLTFSDRSVDPGGRIVLWQWDFDGDGRFDFASDRSGNTSHAYATDGLYVAILRVTDDRGEVNSTSVSIKVSEDAPGAKGPSDSKGAAVCCGALVVVLIISSYWTLRRSLANPRKDLGPARPPGDGGPPPDGQGPPGGA